MRNTNQEEQNKQKTRENIRNFFENMSFSEAYNYDIWITFVVLFIVIMISIYYYILNTIKSRKANWENEKCNPFMMPFASIINSEDASKDPDFNTNNFKSCLNNMTGEAAFNVQKPLIENLNIFSKIFEYAAKIASSIMDFILYLLNLIISLFRKLMMRLRLIIQETNYIYIGINDFIENILGFFAVIYYQISIVAGAVKLIFPMMALSFLMGVVMPALIGFIITLILAIVFKILSIIPFIGVIFIPISIIMMIVSIILLIYFIVMLILYIIFSTQVNNILIKTLDPLTPE